MFTHTPTRTTQPYANPWTRPQSQALMAMLAGKPMYQPNPQDHQRQMQRLAALILGR